MESEMVGGGVIHVCNVHKDFGNGPEWVLGVWVAERGGFNEAHIYVERAEPPVAPGDQIWWQGRKAYWTPKGSDRHDLPLARYGYSTVDTH